jgi:hypothetical protein
VRGGWKGMPPKIRLSCSTARLFSFLAPMSGVSPRAPRNSSLARRASPEPRATLHEPRFSPAGRALLFSCSTVLLSRPQGAPALLFHCSPALLSRPQGVGERSFCASRRHTVASGRWLPQSKIQNPNRKSREGWWLSLGVGGSVLAFTEIFPGRTEVPKALL